MNLTHEQIHAIATAVPLNDIIEYVNSHNAEYKEYLKNDT